MRWSSFQLCASTGLAYGICTSRCRNARRDSPVARDYIYLLCRPRAAEPAHYMYVNRLHCIFFNFPDTLTGTDPFDAWPQ
ncbi:hypothetical protein PF005_g24229 [Phytophthora fragariae]|uniref:Uncharacterized protein n=2 Tax=Phytophthora TaxID=4783 RepID=A0A6A3IG05_9STRA|nr:hypothetical protein PF003_g18863 [Phytophthora fragariae]KAE8979965.1 hypothetical protein PR002_g24267 [Phytophthora rubi]KAE8939715.1 hypothetical protein PF009_g10444 [Phytophthora fragariae]KAE8979398.1 hypothetical protein PF011_g22866 [Phytophthora fragariae]KAE8984426.1 hypothetical protein PR001_g23182 [Phytophthora rubi]